MAFLVATVLLLGPITAAAVAVGAWSRRVPTPLMCAAAAVLGIGSALPSIVSWPFPPGIDDAMAAAAIGLVLGRCARPRGARRRAVTTAQLLPNWRGPQGWAAAAIGILAVLAIALIGGAAFLLQRHKKNMAQFHQDDQ